MLAVSARNMSKGFHCRYLGSVGIDEPEERNIIPNTIAIRIPAIAAITPMTIPPVGGFSAQ